MQRSIPIDVLVAQAEVAATPLEQMDPPTRAMILMALLALVLLGLGLIVMTMIGARWVRRGLRDRKPPRQWPSLQERGEEPTEIEEDNQPVVPLGETIAGLPSDQDTRDDSRGAT